MKSLLIAVAILALAGCHLTTAQGLKTANDSAHGLKKAIWPQWAPKCKADTATCIKDGKIKPGNASIDQCPTAKQCKAGATIFINALNVVHTGVATGQSFLVEGDSKKAKLTLGNVVKALSTAREAATKAGFIKLLIGLAGGK